LFNSVDLEHLTESRDKRRTRLWALIIAQDFERKGVPQAIEATRLIISGAGGDGPRLRLSWWGKTHAPAVEAMWTFVGETAQIRELYAKGGFFCSAYAPRSVQPGCLERWRWDCR